MQSQASTSHYAKDTIVCSRTHATKAPSSIITLINKFLSRQSFHPHHEAPTSLVSWCSLARVVRSDFSHTRSRLSILDRCSLTSDHEEDNASNQEGTNDSGNSNTSLLSSGQTTIGRRSWCDCVRDSSLWSCGR
jgi:hypothetical protein